MMSKTKSRLLVCALLLPSTVLGRSNFRSDNHRMIVSNDEKDDRTKPHGIDYAGLGNLEIEVPADINYAPGETASELDRAGAQCTASGSGQGGNSGSGQGGIATTKVQYYYNIHSTEPVNAQQVQALEYVQFILIQTAILWCTRPNGPSIGGNRKLMGELIEKVVKSPQFVQFAKGRRRLTLEDARRLAIIAVNTAPQDMPVAPGEFTVDEDPCQFSLEPYCVTMFGRMTVSHHASDSSALTVRSIIDATKQVMQDNLLLPPLCTGDECTITRVEWLGVTWDEVVANIIARGADAKRNDGSNRNTPVVVFAAIPMALLLAFALLLARNKRRRDVKTPAELLEMDEDYVIPGTGDPPRSFHEGMYHYTRSGARYLSTNCPDCAETRKNGFFTDSDLPTIRERHLYDPTRTSLPEESFDEVSTFDEASLVEKQEDNDPASYRKRHLVMASARDLGARHSSIDVHHCTSATCRICAYRPRDVAFTTSPRSPSDHSITSSASGSQVV